MHICVYVRQNTLRSNGVFNLPDQIQFMQTGYKVGDFAIFGASKSPYSAATMNIIRNIHGEIKVDDMARLRNANRTKLNIKILIRRPFSDLRIYIPGLYPVPDWLDLLSIKHSPSPIEIF